MCGIAGHVDFRAPPSEQVLRDMEKVLTHRGPDEGRIWRQGSCGLVHRRLRIIDLSAAAAQPMGNEDGRLWVVFNGEIYNFRLLRDELLALGHQFKSRSDTEVILHGYESWGLDVFPRLRGMFAVALWDENTQQCVLARDRLGKKPLFYHADSDRLVFGSELRVFKCVPDLPVHISRTGLREYVQYGYVQGPGSILEGVQRLSPAHVAAWRRGGFETRPFWTLPVVPAAQTLRGNATAAAAALGVTLSDAVRCRLESDVPLGCFLSGGIDSSLVAALAQQHLNGKLKTFTLGFENSKMNEADDARGIARHLGTQHHELMVNESSIVSGFEDILARAPEPIGDDSFIPTHLVSREARQYVTVAVSGDGGDELFAGYPKYQQFAAACRFRRWIPAPWRWLARWPVRDSWRKSFEALAAPDERELARWLSSLWKSEEVPKLLAGVDPTSGEDRFDHAWQARPAYSNLERWMLVDMETYLEGDILLKVDRASMAVGLEARCPYLDHLVIEQALKWHCHADPAQGGKTILKKLLAQYVPERLFERPKKGFGMPIDEWFRGALRKTLLHYTDPERIRRQGLFDPEWLTFTVQQHLSGGRNFGRKLYAIVAFEIWADQFFGRACPLA